MSDELRVDWQSQTSFEELDHPLAFGIIDNETWNAGTELRTVAEHPVFGLDSRFDAGVQLAYTRQPQTIYANQGGHRGASFAASSGRPPTRRSTSAKTSRSATRSRWSAARARSGRGARVRDKVADESDSVEYWFAAPSLGAIWRAVPGAELYANAGYAFEPGVLFELTAPGNATAGLDLEALDPQRAWQFEVGARGGVGERLRFDVAVFDIELRDEIRNVNVVPFPGAPFTVPAYENIDRSRHWGVELALDLQLARDLAAPFGAQGGGELRAQTSYTYSRFEFVRDDAFRQQRPARRAAPLHDRGAALAARLGPLARAAGRVGGASAGSSTART